MCVYMYKNMENMYMYACTYMHMFMFTYMQIYSSAQMSTYM